MQIFPAGILFFTFFVIFIVGEKKELWAVTFNIILCLLANFYSAAAAYKVGFPERVWANLAPSTQKWVLPNCPCHCKCSGAAYCKM